MTTYRVLFSGYDSQDYLQLWSTDGTDAGSVALMVSGASATGIDPEYLTALQSLTVFQGVAADGAADLWSSDGSSAGTQLLLVSGARSDTAGGLAPTDIVRFGSSALFSGYDASGAQQLWITNGTGVGTTQLTSAAGGVTPSAIVSIGARAVYNALDADGLSQLGATDGTAAGTTLIVPTDAGAQGLDPVDISAFGTLGLFFGVDSTGSEGLWKTDGTAAGTVEIAQGVGDPADLSTNFVTLGTVAVFAGIGATGNDELLSTDGASVTTLSPAGASGGGLQPTDITAFQSDALFAGVDATGADQLWITDGVASGTTEVTVVGSATDGLQPSDIVSLGTEALFSGETSTGADLFVTDGTSAGTKEVAVSGASVSGVTPSDIVAYGAGALFEGLDADGDPQLFSYDASTGAASVVTAASAAAFGLAPSDLTVAPVGGVACYLRGTLIQLRSGPRAVELLQSGDIVMTASCGERPIRWVGVRSYAGRFLAANPSVQPVRFCAGALGEGLPQRDLLVSPEHAMFLDGVLVPAKLLVNGTTVLQETDMDVVEYFHIELDSHDVLLAEGAPSESFVDCDSRGMFQNAHTFSGLAPRWSFCAPRVEDGPIVARIRDRLRPRGPTAILSVVRGHLDWATHESCRGWAWVPEDPEATLEIEILVCGNVIARTVANSWRPDVKAHGHGTGRYGFELTFAQPLPRFRTATITARAVGGGDLVGTVRLDAATEIDPAQLPSVAAGLQARAAAAGGAREITGFLLDQLRATRSMQRPRIAGPLAVVLDHAAPRPRQDAGASAITSHMQSLQRLGYQVVFVPLDNQPGPLPEGIVCAAWPEFPNVEDALRQHGDAALVYVHRVEGMSLYGSLIRRICPGARLIYSVADLHFLRLGRQAEIEHSASRMAESRRLREQELAAARQADITLTHSAVEAELLQRLVPGASVRVVPWHVPRGPAPYTWRRRSGLLFVGGMSHAPNADALRWMASDIMPRVAALNPRIRCKLVGAGLTEADRGWLHPAMKVLGPFVDLSQVYRSTRLAVAPIRFGAGVKGKVLEAFAAGLPCAMTPIAAEGLNLPEALGQLVAVDEDAFAALIVALHRDLASNHEAGEAARAFVAGANSETVVDDALGNAAASARARRFSSLSKSSGSEAENPFRLRKKA